MARIESPLDPCGRKIRVIWMSSVRYGALAQVVLKKNLDVRGNSDQRVEVVLVSWWRGSQLDPTCGLGFGSNQL